MTVSSLIVFTQTMQKLFYHAIIRIMTKFVYMVCCLNSVFHWLCHCAAAEHCWIFQILNMGRVYRLYCSRHLCCHTFLVG